MERDALIRIWDGTEMTVGRLSDIAEGDAHSDDIAGKTTEDDTVVMFATGRSDAEGKPIFASDVVEHVEVPEHRAVISWNSDEACYFAHWLDGTAGLSGNMEHARTWRVIGNTYEHPSLVE